MMEKGIVMREKTVKLIAWAGACGLCAFVAFRIAYLCCNIVLEGVPISSDFSCHMDIAQHMMDDGFRGMFYFVSYPMWHLGTYIVHSITNMGWDVSCALNTAMLYGAMFALYYGMFRKEKQLGFWCSLGIALYLIAVQPISKTGLLFQLSGRTQLISAWHNPTNIWPRLLAVPVVILFVKIWEQEREGERASIWSYVLFTVLLAVATLGKPSLVQVFFPSIFLFCVAACFTRKFRPFLTCVKLAICCIPTLLLMLWQASLSFEQDGRGGVEIAWFKVMAATNKANLIVILGAIVFPLFYFVAYKKWKQISSTLLLAWVMYGVSFLEYAALAEVGDRTYHSNFGWGYMIALMILHMSSVLEFAKEEKGRKWFVGCLIMAMHFICGVSWIMLEMTEKGLLCQMGLLY